MNIVLALRNFSFYTGSETCYIQGKVFEIKKDPQNSKPNASRFADIRVGSTINLKYPCNDPAGLAILITDKIIRVRSAEFILPTDPNRGITFVAETIAKCEILAVRKSFNKLHYYNILFLGRIVKNAKWPHPVACILSGSSGIGKTSFTLKLIMNQHFTKKIEHVFYFGAGQEQAKRLKWHKKLEDVAVQYYEGLPSSNFFSTIPKHSIVVIDDQFEESINSPQIAKAFRMDRRHKEFSIILITQSIFENGKYAKCIRNNSEILVLFKNYG